MENGEDPHCVTTMFFPSISYYHISKSVLPSTFQKWRFLLFSWQPQTSSFHVTHRTLTVNQQSSHGKLDVPRSGEQLRCSEMRLRMPPCQPSQPLPGAELGDSFPYSWATSSAPTSWWCFLSGLCWQRGCWCWMSGAVGSWEYLFMGNPRSSPCCLSAGRASTSPHLQTLLRHSQAQRGEMQQAEGCGCWGKRVPWPAAHPVSEMRCRWCWAKPACHITRSHSPLIKFNSLLLELSRNTASQELPFLLKSKSKITRKCSLEYKTNRHLYRHCFFLLKRSQYTTLKQSPSLWNKVWWGAEDQVHWC